MARWRGYLGAALALGFLAAGCGNGDEAGPGGTPPEQGPVKVGMALPTQKDDRGFSQSHYEGLLAAEEELNIQGSVIERVGDPEKAIDGLKNLAADNDLVIGVGAQFAEAGVIVAPQFPDVTFMIINGQTSDAPNLFVYGIRQGVPAYVAGVVAGQQTETRKIGFIGGIEIPPTTQSDDGFREGAQSVDPSIESVSTVVGDFDDAAKAKEAAIAQIAAGADVIFGFVNAGLSGIIDAATESGKDVKVFGVIVPRCDEFPELMGTAVLDSGALVKSMVNDFLNGTIPAEPRFYGVETPEIQRFELCPAFATEELTALVNDTQQGIVSGEIQLPEGV